MSATLFGLTTKALTDVLKISSYLINELGFAQ